VYVFVAPCIVNPLLRAKGITTDEDREYFAHCLERCREFGVEVVSLPCPETEYLGMGREPGSYLERLNTQDFEEILQQCEQDVRAVMDERGPPLCIVGVDSSPACGINTTYYTEVKEPGRGAFLGKFSEIPAFDVKDFSAYRVAIVSDSLPFYGEPLLSVLCENLRTHCFLPVAIGNPPSSEEGADWVIQILTSDSEKTSMQLFRGLSDYERGSEHKLVVYSDCEEVLTALRRKCGM